MRCQRSVATAQILVILLRHICHPFNWSIIIVQFARRRRRVIVNLAFRRLLSKRNLRHAQSVFIPLFGNLWFLIIQVFLYCNIQTLLRRILVICLLMLRGFNSTGIPLCWRRSVRVFIAHCSKMAFVSLHPVQGRLGQGFPFLWVSRCHSSLELFLLLYYLSVYILLYQLQKFPCIDSEDQLIFSGKLLPKEALLKEVEIQQIFYFHFS